MVEKKPLHLHTLDAKKIQQLDTYDNHVLALGHCMELCFTHSDKPGVEIRMLAIPNDYGLMDIEFK